MPSNLEHSSQSVPGSHVRRSSQRNVRLFALLIGVNDYSPSSGFSSLRGAVSDAHRFREYLETRLAVPSKHITMLTESQATRSSIIKAFQTLEVDERIDKGDAILVYFAGHGTQMKAPAWMNSGPEAHIQAIVPYDFGHSVQPIPDCTLGALLSRIADKKGDNITVIFDCCHSGSGTRGGPTSDHTLIRGGLLVTPPEFPADLDQEILNTGTRGAYVPSKYAMRGLTSHTLLAACGANQAAEEYRGEGRFSSSLLTLLGKVSPEDLRYCDILNDSRFPVISNGQTPQCEGLNTDRVLFNGTVQCFRRKQFPIRYDHNKRVYIVEAGDIHRITPATTFEIYQKSDTACSNAVGILEVKKVEAFVSQAVPIGQPVIDAEQPLIAVVSGPSQAMDLRMRIPQNDHFLNVWKGLCNDEPELGKISVVKSSSAPEHLVVESTPKNQVRFTIRVDNWLPGVPGVSTSSVQYIPNDPTDLRRMFSRSIDFFGGLEHGLASGSGFNLLKNIQVNFRQLKQELTDELRDTFIPVGPNLCENNIINVPVTDEDSAIYGLDITNKSSADLYVNMFYFDTNTLQIQSVIKPHVGHRGNVDVPLERESGTLTIGYGSGGAPPILFTTDKDTEVGFFKLYLSTRPVNLSYLVQDYSVQESQYTSRGMIQKVPDPKTQDFWTSIVIPVILRKQQAVN